jgi:hypothetical protein
MKGPEPLYRLKVERAVMKPNPEYTGYGCGVLPYLPTGETHTEYFGPYVRRHAATSMKGVESAYGHVVSAEIETCRPEWSPVS